MHRQINWGMGLVTLHPSNKAAWHAAQNHRRKNHNKRRPKKHKHNHFNRGLTHDRKTATSQNKSGLCLHVKWLLNSMCQKGQFVSGGHNPEQTILRENSISRNKPWEYFGISRMTWYRRGKPNPPEDNMKYLIKSTKGYWLEKRSRLHTKPK